MFRLVPLAMNRQPGAVSWCPRPGDNRYRAFALSVVTVAGGRVHDITACHLPDLVPLFGQPRHPGALTPVPDAFAERFDYAPERRT